MLEHSREHSRGHKHSPRDHLYVVDDDEQRAKDPEGLDRWDGREGRADEADGGGEGGGQHRASGALPCPRKARFERAGDAWCGRLGSLPGVHVDKDVVGTHAENEKDPD